MAGRLRGGSAALIKVLVQPHQRLHVFRVNQSVLIQVCLVGLPRGWSGGFRLRWTSPPLNRHPRP